MGKIRRKIENNLIYAENQFRSFLRYEYGLNYDVDVYALRGLEKRGKYAELVFKRGKPVAIDLSYDLVRSGSKERILQAVLREAVRVALWYKRVPYGETDIEYSRELKKHNLPIYEGMSQVGEMLHTYGCSVCKKIYLLRRKEVGENIVGEGLVTMCCKEKFKYMGEVFYSNKKLRELRRQLLGLGVNLDDGERI